MLIVIFSHQILFLKMHLDSRILGNFGTLSSVFKIVGKKNEYYFL